MTENEEKKVILPINRNDSIISQVYYESQIIEDYKKNKKKTFSIIFFMSLIITVYNIIKGYSTKHPKLEKRLYFLFFFYIN